MLTDFDAWAVTTMNVYARQNWLFDKSVAFLLDANSLKALPFIVILTGFWFTAADRVGRRRTVLSTIVGALIAMVVTRIWQNEGPMRLRPREEPALNFQVPAGDQHELLASWSSFPSDTAGLTMALAVGILLMSRPLGALMLAWALIGVCLPRIYFGLHYPTDIVVGGLVGGASVLLVAASPLPDWIGKPAAFIEARWPAVFYAGFMIAAFQISTYFLDIRVAGTRLLNATDGPTAAEPVQRAGDPTGSREL